MKENTERGERSLEYLGDVTGKMVDIRVLVATNPLVTPTVDATRVLTTLNITAW
jgi:hypothetical protein